MRIQILLLPSIVNGDDVEEPFALIVDQVPAATRAEVDGETWQRFREQCGAKALLVTSETVDVVDRYAGDAAECPPRTAVHVNMPPGLDVDEVSAEARRQVRNLGDSWT